MNIDELLYKYRKINKFPLDICLYFKPYILEKKAINAINSYAFNIGIDNILLLIDDTTFERAKDGLLVTLNGLYYHGFLSDMGQIEFNKIDKIMFVYNTLFINNKRFF
jgi:hypothetical protein